jgi:hypothetical protein
VWERFGTFAGHPLIRGEVVWSAEDRSVVISGRRGDRRLEEIVEWASLHAFVSHLGREHRGLSPLFATQSIPDDEKEAVWRSPHRFTQTDVKTGRQTDVQTYI